MIEHGEESRGRQNRHGLDIKNARERRPGWVPGGFLPAAGPMQAGRRAGPMMAGKSPGGGNLRRLLDEFKRLLNIFLSDFAVFGCFVSVLCHSAIPAGAAWPMMTGGPRTGCAAAAPGPGCSRQAGRY